MEEITYSEAVLQEYKIGMGSFAVKNCRMWPGRFMHSLSRVLKKANWSKDQTANRTRH